MSVFREVATPQWAIHKRHIFLDIWTLEEATTMLSRNGRHHSIGDAATHPRITETSSDYLAEELTN